MKLRAHQKKAIQMIRESLIAGKKKPVLAAPCSFGKTITAAYILKSAAEKGKRGVFICDRVKLIQQSLEEFDELGLDYGVMQGLHELTDHTKPIQIASIQTLARRRQIDFDIAIVDECHTHYKTLTNYMEAFNNVPFIGLSATPYSRGLGQHYDNLLVPITPQELLDQGYLCPIHYYGGKKPDLSGVKSKRIGTGGQDYDPDSLAAAYDDDHALAGDIVENWIKHGENSQTIAFSPSIKHSKYLVDLFNQAGIPACHIDGYMLDEERQILYEAHDRGEYKILSCSRLLNTGYDAPQVRCLIDAYPTRSLISYVQRGGRIQRTSPGKEYAIYLDHAGNVNKHGFVESIVPESLDDGEHKYSERNQVKEKKEPKVNDCPQCTQQFVGIQCKACGYEIPVQEQIVTDNQILERITKSNNKTFSQDQKGQWLGELYLYAAHRGYSEGWAAHKYKEKFGVWPNKVKPTLASEISPEVSRWIKSQQIRYIKGKEKYESRNNLATSA